MATPPAYDVWAPQRNSLDLHFNGGNLTCLLIPHVGGRSENQENLHDIRRLALELTWRIWKIGIRRKNVRQLGEKAWQRALF